MNVYKLKPTGCYGGGMALVAAYSFEIAKSIYLENGAFAEEYFLNDFSFDKNYSEPIAGLEWHGEQGIIT